MHNLSDEAFRGRSWLWFLTHDMNSDRDGEWVMLYRVFLHKLEETSTRAVVLSYFEMFLHWFKVVARTLVLKLLFMVFQDHFCSLDVSLCFFSVFISEAKTFGLPQRGNTAHSTLTDGILVGEPILGCRFSFYHFPEIQVLVYFLCSFSFSSKSIWTTLGGWSTAKTTIATRASEKSFPSLNRESTHQVTYINMSH